MVRSRESLSGSAFFFFPVIIIVPLAHTLGVSLHVCLYLSGKAMMTLKKVMTAVKMTGKVLGIVFTASQRYKTAR